MRRLALITVGLLLALFALPLLAQDQADMSEEAQKDFFVQFVQDRLSTPERRISLSNIEGLLSNRASIDEIAVSDKDGVWLRIKNAAIDWNQGALLGGRLEVSRLTAASIEYIRNPVESGTDLPSPESSGFEVPEFPVAIDIGEISVPSVTFGEGVFGLDSEIALTGRVLLDGGTLSLALGIERLDGPGGRFDLALDYARDSNEIDLDLTLTEPEDGIVANLLNIEGRPDIELNVAGSGPVADLRAELAFVAGGRTALSGAATIGQSGDGFSVAADLRGPLATLMAPPYRPFFGEETSLTLNADIARSGVVTLSALRFSGGQVMLEASGATAHDGFISTLRLNALVADPQGGLVTLPVPGNASRLAAGRIAIDYGGGGDEDWTGTLDLDGLQFSDLGADRLTFAASGIATNLDDPATRRVTFNGDGALEGISGDEEIEAALGDRIGLGVAALWAAGEPIRLAEFRVLGEALELAISGAIDDFAFTGDVGIRAASIAPFSGVAERELTGALDLAASGTVAPLAGTFDLALDGTGTNLAVDQPLLDPLLAGQVQLSGRIGRNELGLTADRFELSNEQIQIRADGRFASTEADFTFSLDLTDLALISEDAEGPMSIVGTATGQESIIDLTLNASVPSGRLVGRTLRNAQLALTGTLNEGDLAGAIEGIAFLDGHRVSLTSALSSSVEGQRLSGLVFETIGARATGDLFSRADGMLVGQLRIHAPDISTAASLALQEATGSVTLDLTLDVRNEIQHVSAQGDIEDLAAEGIKIGAASIRLEANDPFGVPLVDGSLNGTSIQFAGVSIDSFAAEASQSSDLTRFSANAGLANNADISLAGSLRPLGDGFQLGLDRATLTQGSIAASLAEPATLTISGGTVAMNNLTVEAGGGRLTASGTAGDSLDISAQITNLPLSLANAIRPDLGLAGTVNGSARVTGPSADPQATFTLAARGIEATATRELGLSSLTIDATGRYADDFVRLDDLHISDGAGLSLSGQGRVPLGGRGMSLDVSGSAPLSIASSLVIQRGGQLSGAVSLEARVTGSLADPAIAGRVSTTDAEYVDPLSNLRLTGITGTASLSGDVIAIDSLSASLATGGTVSASGTVGLGAGLPADLAVQLHSARYADGQLFVATASGSLSLTGSLAQSPTLSGDLFLEQANIFVPQSFGDGSIMVEVQHVAPPPAVRATLERVRVAEGSPVPQSRPSVLQLDLRVSAPNQIFVRGRGLDAEVGGSVWLRGPVSDVRPIGGFELIRGRLAILGRRLDFQSGTVTLVGDLDPYLNFVAQTEGEGIVVFVTVSGRASDINVAFTSNPALPEDEVLSRLIFNRSVGELSPFQIAQLAAAVAELTGGAGDNSLLSTLRDAAGLADLDVVTDENGNVAVRAGGYIQNNVYLGVEAGVSGESRVSIDLDITDEITARGSAGTDGSSSVGLFFETDY